MIIALVVTAILLTLVYLAAGGFKLATPKQKLQPQMGWVEDYSTTTVKVIAAVEVLGALGVILPLVTGIAPVLTGVAAIGLVLVQIGAAIVHIRRGEQKQLPVNVVLLLLALAVAILRFATL